MTDIRYMFYSGVAIFQDSRKGIHGIPIGKPFDSYCENVSSGGHVPNQTTGVKKAWISQRRRPVHLEICTYLNEMSRNKKRALRVLDVGGGAFSFLSSTCQPKIVPDIADFRTPEFYGNKAEYNKYANLHKNMKFMKFEMKP